MTEQEVGTLAAPPTQLPPPTPPPIPPPPPVPPSATPVTAPRLQDAVRRRLGAWRRIGAPSHVLRWLREGVRAEWLDGPPRPFHHGVTTFSPEERRWLSSERDRCLGTGAWRRARCFDFVSRAFIVEHKGKKRLVLDFRNINLHHVKRGCRFESLSRLRRMARRGDWVFSIDLQDAYHHLGVHEDDQRYFTFALQTEEGTEYFSTSALSFGWCMSPFYFTQMLKPVVSYFRNPTVGTAVSFGQREAGPAQQQQQQQPPPLPPQPQSQPQQPPPPPSLPPAIPPAFPQGLSAPQPPAGDDLSDAGSEPPPLVAFPPGLGLEPPLGAMLASPVPPPLPPPPPPTGSPESWAARTCALERRIEMAISEQRSRLEPRYAALRAAGASSAQLGATEGMSIEEIDALLAVLPADASDEALADALADALRPRRSHPGEQPWRAPPPPPPSRIVRALMPIGPPPTTTTPSPSRAAQRRERRRRGPRPARPQRARTAEIGCRVLPWLDDFAFFKAGTRVEAVAQRDHVFFTLEDLGLTRSPTKGQPEPSHVLEDHLGYGIDTERGLLLLTTSREAKLRRQAAGLLGHAARHRRHVRTRALAGFAGLAQASSLAVPLARFWLRSVYDDIVAGGHRWSGYTRLSRQAMADIAEWRRLRGSRHVGRAIWLAPDSAVGHVDAGPYGWGGQLDYQSSLPPAWGFWSPEEADLHITFRELRAVRLFIEHYVDSLRGRRLLLYEDNQAVVAILTNRTTRSPLLMAELRLIVELLAEADLTLRATYIRSAANTVADYFSRIARPHEYVVTRDVFSRIAQWWGECTVDAFASAASAQLHRYWAESFDDLGAEAVDAFAQEWCGERVWAHPPPHLLPQLAQLLRARPGVEAFVCAPLWPGESWYAELLAMCSERVTFAAGSFERVAADAPPRLESWPCTIFRIVPVAAE